MELSLHGSQINLATRDKATNAPAVNYPVYLTCPGSASVTLTTPSACTAAANKYSNSRSKSTASLANQLRQHHLLRHSVIKRRPVSADCSSQCTQTTFSTNVKDHPCANEQLSCSTRNIQHKNKSTLTSSNIYKLLLAEPIKRSWMTSDARTSNNEATNAAKTKRNESVNKMKETETKPLSNDSYSDGTSSCDEDIEEKVLSRSSDDDGNDVFNLSTPNESNKLILDQTLKTAVDKPKTVSSIGATKNNLVNGNGSQLSSSLRPIKESKANHTKYQANKEPKSDKIVHVANAETSSSESKVMFNVLKTDLPGRVSFSKNDVYEIDYSDYENDTDTGRSLEPGEVYRKKNVRFKDDFFQATEAAAFVDDENEKINISSKSSSGGSSDEEKMFDNNSGAAKTTIISKNEDDKFCCSLKSCNNINGSNGNSEYVPLISSAQTTASNTVTFADTRESIDNSEKIIEEYKREIQNINRRHELELKWSGNKPMADAEYLIDTNEAHIIGNNENGNMIYSTAAQPLNEFDDKERSASDYWSSPDATNSPVSNSRHTASISNASEDSPTRDSTSTVINNYLKTKTIAVNAAPKATSTTSIKLRTSSVKKKPLAFQSSNANGRKIKSAQSGAVGKSAQNSKLTKARSISCLQNNTNDVAKLNEFHIDKVESWMSTHHEDTFSDTGLSTSRKGKLGGSSANLEYKKAWRETPTSNKTDDEGNFSLDDQLDTNSVDDSSYGEIELVLKKMEGRRMKISFDSIKNTPTAPSLPIGSSSVSQQTQHHIVSNSSTANDQSSDKIKEILQYLDEVDYNCDRTINNIQLQKIPDSYLCGEDEYNLDTMDIVGEFPKMNDLLSISKEQLARRIITLSLRTNELSNAIKLSKEHVENVRNDKQKAIRLEKQSAQVRLKEQKAHCEGIVTRHQGFIEQLLKDKASLCEQVSTLTRRIESQNQSSEHKLQTELARFKETAIVGEKIRRERWVRENTKKIKELTVKGLEQEINKMNCNHQKEIMDLKRQHQQEILDAVEDARQKHEVTQMGIRDSYAHDREAAIEKERNAIRERFERQIEIEQKTFEEQKSRLIVEFSCEKERLLSEHRQTEHDFELRRDKLLQEKKDLAEHLHREFADKVRMIEKRNQSEMVSIREQFESDFAIWKRDHETMYKLREVENSNAIHQQCRLERDKQIDSIVAKVDAESLKIQQDYETKISRLKGQYDAELRDMERIERQSREKYTESRSKLAECDANIHNLHASVKQLEIQLSHSQRMCDNFAAEKENFKENARKEIQEEIDALRKERDDEILQIHKRVQHAIAKKDASMDVLQKENAALKDRSLKLEAIIRQQRKDYCTK